MMMAMLVVFFYFKFIIVYNIMTERVSCNIFVYRKADFDESS